MKCKYNIKGFLIFTIYNIDVLVISVGIILSCAWLTYKSSTFLSYFYLSILCLILLFSPLSFYYLMHACTFYLACGILFWCISSASGSTSTGIVNNITFCMTKIHLKWHWQKYTMCISTCCSFVLPFVLPAWYFFLHPISFLYQNNFW